MPCLVLNVFVGEAEPVRVELDGEHFVVGREPGVAILIKDEVVSRRHLLFAWVDERWLVQDLHSANGITLNGERIKTAEVRENDVVGVGENGPRIEVVAAENIDPSDLDRTRFFRP